YCDTYGEVALMVWLSGRPFSSAATRVNALNEEPAWYPVTSPPPLISGLVVAGQVPRCPRFCGLVFAPLWLSSLLYTRLVAMSWIRPVPGSTPASISAVGLLPVRSYFSTYFFAAACALTSIDRYTVYPPLLS